MIYSFALVFDFNITYILKKANKKGVEKTPTPFFNDFNQKYQLMYFSTKANIFLNCLFETLIFDF